LVSTRRSPPKDQAAPPEKKPTVFLADFADDAAASAQKKLKKLGGRLTVSVQDGVEVRTITKSLDG
jgi:hypothetical protein